MNQSQTRNSFRPRKCRLCWRRFKYASCVSYHMLTEHKETIMLLMRVRKAQKSLNAQVAVQQKITEILANEIKNVTVVEKPVRISVIKQNPAIN